jgi:hypothetical protein
MELNNELYSPIVLLSRKEQIVPIYSHHDHHCIRKVESIQGGKRGTRKGTTKERARKEGGRKTEQIKKLGKEKGKKM